MKSLLKNAGPQPSLHVVTSVAAQADVVVLTTDKALAEVHSEEMVLLAAVLVVTVVVVAQPTPSQLAVVVHNKLFSRHA